MKMIKIHKTKGMKLSTKIALFMIALLVLVFFLMNFISLTTAEKSLAEAINGEFTSIATENGLRIKNVINDSDSIANNLISYVTRSFSNDKNKGVVVTTKIQNKEDEGISDDLRSNLEEINGMKKSKIHDITLDEVHYNIEQYVLNTCWSVVKDNESIAGVGIYFEPYRFDDEIEGYSLYVMNSNIDNQTADKNVYSVYGHKEYYTSLKETGEPYYSEPYFDDHGIAMITITYPMVYNGEFLGMILVDVDMSLFQTFHMTDDNYSSMCVTLLKDNGLLIYDSQNPKEMGMNLKEIISEKTYANVMNNFTEGKPFTAKFKGIDGEEYTGFYLPINLGSEQWWTQSALHTSDLNKENVSLLKSMILISVVSLAIIVFAMTKLLSKMLKPVNSIVSAAEQIKDGDLNISIDVKSNDEIGKLSNTFNDMANNLKSIISDVGHNLGEMAKGNFMVSTSCEEKYIGEYRNILSAMDEINKNLSDTLLQMNQSADQVSSGSDQVANGSQALSQGTTEQAASIQELSAAIDGISHKIKTNADNAKTAKDVSIKSTEEILKGNQKMVEMITAMEEISEKSSQISKIIKTIDNIAFQTNILALNAAVEAARAGSAGKGFAVVADEVRNLAQKSAKAAKNTTELIESSLTSVDNGTKIADETATFLKNIVDGAKQSTEIIEKIALASNDQATEVIQVTQGVDQISSVVQTNSATAEESAAASEELSGQAQMLKDLISKFNLDKDNSLQEFSDDSIDNFVSDDIDNKSKY